MCRCGHLYLHVISKDVSGPHCEIPCLPKSVNIQIVSVVGSCRGIQMFLAKVDEDKSSFGIDAAHYCDLGVSLGEVFLVNADQYDVGERTNQVKLMDSCTFSEKE